MQKGPNFSVHQNRIAEKLRDDGGIGNPAGGGLRSTRIEKGAVPVKGPILNDQGDFIFSRRKIERQLLLVPNQIKSRQTGINIEPGNTEGVIVIPECRRPLCVGISVNSSLKKGTGFPEPAGEPSIGMTVAVRRGHYPMGMDDRPYFRVSTSSVNGFIDRKEMSVGKLIQP